MSIALAAPELTLGAIEASRDAILREIGDPPDLTFVRGAGNRGDELIWEGTRRLLSSRIYREIDLDELCGASGHTVLLTGGGAFCRPFCELMPRALAVAELRFQRVIVLPSSVDPSEDCVREALARTRATVFARERVSYERIRSLCDARLAHDCAFFFDFTPYRREGKGVLNAFRTDAEALGSEPLPRDNRDISATAPSLEEWLSTIADHEKVRTDRAHVMIAAALLGKSVEVRPSAYHKVTAIADYALRECPVRRLASDARAVAVPEPPGAIPAASRARVTAIVVTRDRPHQVLGAVDSVLRSSPGVEVVVIDENSASRAAANLAAACSERERMTLLRSERRLGAGGALRLGLRAAESEFVLLLDEETELEPGALAELVDVLDAHPETVGVTATVLLPDGSVEHSGGWMRVSSSMVELGLREDGVALESVLGSGPVDWLPGTACLIRRSALEALPWGDGMHYEDVDWSYRVEQAEPGSFRSSLEAKAVHRGPPATSFGREFARRSEAVERLAACARFYAQHGKLLNVDLFAMVPELVDADGRADLAAARLLMELVAAKGTDWAFMEWMNGGLDVLLSANRRLTEARGAQDELKAALAAGELNRAYLQGRHETLTRIEEGGWWRLRKRLDPALRLYSRLRGGGEG